MFRLSSDDRQLYFQFANLLSQINIPPSVQNFPDQIDVKINFNSDKIKVSVNEKSFILTTPLQLKDFQIKLSDLLNESFLIINNMKYFPYLQKLESEKKSISLNHIHNQIFQYLVINQVNGIDKETIYRLIWPNDKNIYLNKIDTHISNLKKFLDANIQFKLNYQIKNNKIFLIRN